ncbi:uncharacterized protein LODBEIA_P44100 [Lodderomyces beijingensis]|uniref:RGS domain-containing protein n=1 Tax=Lodderomyces beijingensis TaxID=1775926 RepID=A0ABP0ZT90_9ASCO
MTDLTSNNSLDKGSVGRTKKFAAEEALIKVSQEPKLVASDQYRLEAEVTGPRIDNEEKTTGNTCGSCGNCGGVGVGVGVGGGGGGERVHEEPNYHPSSSTQVDTESSGNKSATYSKCNRDRNEGDIQPTNSRIKNVDEFDVKQKQAREGAPASSGADKASSAEGQKTPAQQSHDGPVTSNTGSASTRSTKFSRMVLLSSLKTWFNFKDFGVKITDEVKSIDSEGATTDMSSHECLTQLPNIPFQYRPKEVNGFGILSQSQSLPSKIKRQFELLLTSALQLELEFCQFLEMLHERSKRQDIRNIFLSQFDKMHRALPFTVEYLNANDDISEEMSLHLKVLFGDIFNNNFVVWIANKFEYNQFSRRFRKTVVEVLRNDYQFDISYRRETFYRQIIAASLIQWRRHIPFSD